MTGPHRGGPGPGRRPQRRRVGLVVAAALVLFVLAGAWLGWSGVQARQELNRAQALLPTLRAQLAGQDLAGARATAVQFSGHTAEARRLTGDPLWRVAGLLPYAGHNPRTVTTLSAAADDLSRDVLLPVIDEAGGLDVSMLTPASGGVDLALIESKAPLVSRLDSRLEQIVTEVEHTPRSGLIGPVATARTSLLTQVHDLAAQVSVLDAAVRLMPAMLGADGARTYLVLFQDTAQARTPGGAPGIFAVVRADEGALTLAGVGGPGDLGGAGSPLPGAPSPDAGVPPPWGPAAEGYRQRYAARTGEQVDGVIAADPVVASYLLSGASAGGQGGSPDPSTPDPGPGDRPGTSVQDSLYGAVAADFLARLTSGSTDPTALVSGLRRGADEGRLLLWSAHPDQQEILAGTVLDGSPGPSGPGGDG